MFVQYLVHWGPDPYDRIIINTTFDSEENLCYKLVEKYLSSNTITPYMSLVLLFFIGWTFPEVRLCDLNAYLWI